MKYKSTANVFSNHIKPVTGTFDALLVAIENFVVNFLYPYLRNVVFRESYIA